MFFAQKMNRVTVAVLQRDVDAVLEAVARLGVLHPAQLAELETWANDLTPGKPQDAIAETEKRRAQLAAYVDGPLPPPPEASAPLMTLQQIDETLSLVDAQLSPLLEAHRTAAKRCAELETIAGQIEALLPSGLPIASLLQSAYLACFVGTLPEKSLRAVEAQMGATPHVVFPYGDDKGRLEVVCVALRRDAEVFEAELHAAGFEAAETPNDLGVLSLRSRAQVNNELAATKKKLAHLDGELAEKRAAILPELFAAQQSIDAQLTLLRLQEFCRATDQACVFSGWVPEMNTETFARAVRASTSGRAVIEIRRADTLESQEDDPLEVPVLAQYPKLLRPFALLVDSFGVPAYRMVDPTAFVAVSFLFMFGMMFGDLGQGLVLAIVGGLLWKRGLGDIGKLVIGCGASSMVFGTLYGSVFGFEHAIPTLWVKPLDDVNAVFAAAIAFGVTMISLGLILNFINAIRKGALIHELFDEAGPLAAVAYWSAIGIAIKTLWGGTVGALPIAVLVGLPLAAIFAKGPVLVLLHKRDKICPDGAVGYVMECVVKILEILMGFLANTVSFIRVAAFGMAHAGLFIAVFSIADAVSGGVTGTAASVVVHIAGNVVIIVLEGMVVTIQALRLEYYEFFGKFFTSVGIKYQPVSFAPAALHKAD